MLLKVRVTDLKGQRISFLRATVRHFSTIISWLTVIVGFLMVAVAKKKHALIVAKLKGGNSKM